MRSIRIKPLLGVILSILLLVVVCSPRISSLLCLPERQRMVVGENHTLQLELPLLLADRMELKLNQPTDDLYYAGQEPTITLNRVGSLYEINALQPGIAQLQLNLFGHIPLRTIEVETLASRRVVPGGHSIGVILHADGIMVVGFAAITTLEGQRVYPAKEQGIQIGDVIFQVDDTPVKDEMVLARLIDERQGENVTLHVQRKGEEIAVPVHGVYCSETDRFRIGLYVRDSVVGVGTLSCWDPRTGQYAALGHRIEDADTGQIINVLEGELVSASIQTIKAGKPGMPGEKIGILDTNGLITGDIVQNNEFGIFGHIDQKVQNPLYRSSVEVAYAHQVHEGPAKMLTVINGQDIESFDIYIKKVYPQRQNGKGMVIQVTDPRLISISGGIVQGMSGSPIIQDERMVGVVTHVFLNDPLSGYGAFSEQILSNIPLLSR